MNEEDSAVPLAPSTRYELRPVGHELAYIRLGSDLAPPLQAKGFLMFDPAQGELVAEVRGGKILVWVQDKKVANLLRRPRHGA